MAVKNRLNIQRQKPGANATGLLIATSALIVNGFAVAGKLVLGKVNTITSPDVLIEFGITAAYDTANKCLVHYHITEFFRMAAPGTTLYFMVVPTTVLPAVILEDTDSIYCKKLLLEAQGKVRQLAIGFNPDLRTVVVDPEVVFVEASLDGFSAPIRSAIPKATVLRQWAAARNMDLCILLEGRKYGNSASAAVNLRGIVVAGDQVNYEGVSVVIGQDFTFADTLWASGQYHAAVGTALGTLAGIQMEQDMGEVETLNVTDSIKGLFTVAGLSSHVTITEAEPQLDTLDDKGYIFLIKYVNVTGFRFNGDHVCAAEIIDDEGVMNEHKLSYTRTVNECIRSLYDVLIPKVRTTHMVDAQTGKLPLAKIKYFNAIGDKAMKRLSGVSDAVTDCDPDSDLFTPPRQLAVKFQVVPFATIGKINGFIALKTSL